MNTTTTQEQLRRESWIFGGWGGADDDVPQVPDWCPLATPQARRVAVAVSDGRGSVAPIPASRIGSSERV
jgi:hypothetical protein